MKALIISDTHGNCKNLLTVLERIGKIDLLLHLGDVERDEDYIPCLVDCPVHIVRGNNDYRTSLPSEEVVEFGAYRIYLTHGHTMLFRSRGMDAIWQRAQELGAGIALFGHTHEPCLIQDRPVTLLNPGSLSRPRQEGRKPSYALMETDRFGVVHFTINFLN